MSSAATTPVYADSISQATVQLQPPVTIPIIIGSSGTALSMVVSTDQPQYQPNSIVNVQGQVTDASGNPVPDATITVQVDTPTGAELVYTNNILTNSAGTFQTQVALGANAQSGTYTVFASASKPGYPSITTQTAFVVGTSSTPSVIIKSVYSGDNNGNPMQTFTNGQTIWIWIVIQNIGTPFQGVVWVQVSSPSGVSVQIKTQSLQLQADQTADESFAISLPGNAPIGVYSVNALISDKLISQGGTFLASSETQFDLTG